MLDAGIRLPHGSGHDDASTSTSTAADATSPVTVRILIVASSVPGLLGIWPPGSATLRAALPAGIATACLHLPLRAVCWMFWLPGMPYGVPTERNVIVYLVAKRVLGEARSAGSA